MSTRPAPMTQDQFELWVTDMHDALDGFMERLPPRVREALDYSPASLDALEAWILETYPDTASMLAEDQSRILDGAGRYIGETYRRTLGGHWDIDLDNPKNLYYSIPVLTGFSERPTPIAPVTLATSSADRRRGTHIRTILESTLKRKG